VDYYALGITLWVLLTGKEPFVNEKGHPLYEGQIALDTIQGKTADLLLARAPDLSRRMQTLIRGLLTVRHDKRWGYNEVSRFLSGEDVEVFAESVRDLPPIEIAGEKYYQYIDAARALLEHREEGKTLVFKGKLVAWLIRIDQEFGEKMYDLVETWSAQNRLDEGLVFIAYNLCPSLPFTVGEGKSISSLQDMISLLETNPESLIPFLRDEKGDFYIYLDAVGMGGIGNKVREVVHAVHDNFRLVPRITVALKGNAIKPFQDGVNNDLELREIEQLYNLSEYLKERALLFIERRCGELPAWIENLTGKNLELWLCKLDHQKEKLAGWGKWKYFTLFLRGTDIQCGEVIEKNGKKGFTDPLGNELLPRNWEDVKPGITGSFVVKQNGKWGVVKADGSVMLPLDYHDIAIFDEERHLYTVCIFDKAAQEKEWQIRTEGGNTLSHSRKNEPFRIVGIGDRRFFWDKALGRVVIRNENGEMVKDSSWSDFEEYAAAPVAVFKENGKCGIASADGTVIIPAEYDSVVIHGGGARYFVSKEGKWGLLNPPHDQSAQSFSIPCEYDTLQCDKAEQYSYILQKNGVFDVYFCDPAIHAPVVCHIVKKDSMLDILDSQKNVLATVRYIRGFAQTFDDTGWRGGDIAFKDDKNFYCRLKCYDGEKFTSVNIKTGTVTERAPDPGDGENLSALFDGKQIWAHLKGLQKQNRLVEMNRFVNASWSTFFNKDDWETARRILWFIKPDTMEGLDKNYDHYRAAIGDTLFGQKFFEEAVEFYEEAIKLNPVDENHFLGCSIACSNLGAYDKALGYIDKALNLNPQRAFLLAHKGSVLFGLKKFKESIVLYSQAIEAEETPQVLAGYYQMRGFAYQSLGMQNEANDNFAKAKMYE
jgi:hypothetical protein